MRSKLAILLLITFSVSGGAVDDVSMLKLDALAGRPRMLALLDSARSQISVEPDIGVEYAKRALELAYALKDDSAAGAALHEIGKGNYFQNNYAAALEYWRMSLNIREKLGDKRGAVSTMNNLGIVFFEISKYEQALDYHFRALKIKEELGDKKSIANTLNNIGSVYNILEDKEQALEYFYRSLSINEELKDPEGMSINLNNIGGIYKDTKRYSEAIECYQRALQIENDAGEVLGASVVLANMGDLYSETGEYGKADDYYLRALVLKEQVHDRRGIANLSVNMGKLYIRTGELKKADDFLHRGLDMSMEVGAKDYTKNCYEQLYLLQAARKDYKKSLEYHELYCKIKDELYSESSRRRIAEMQAFYEVERKDKEILELSIKTSHQSLMRKLFMAAAALLFIAAGLLFASLTIKRRSNRLLQDKNKQLENANRLLKKSEHQLMDVLDEKDKFLSMVSHDLKNPLTSVVGTSDYLAAAFNNLKEEEKIKFVRNIRNSGMVVQNLLENLLSYARTQTGRLKVVPEKFNLKDAVNDTVEMLKMSAEDKNIAIINETGDGFLLHADRKMVESVIRNLLSNSIKFTGRGGHIRLNAAEEDSLISISVIDDGIGIKSEDMNKLFHEDARFSIPGTENEKGTGLGLVLCKEFVEKNGGTISAKSTIGEGSCFTFTIRKWS